MRLILGTASCRSSSAFSPSSGPHDTVPMALPPGLGKLDRRTGKREQAQEHLTTATTMYCEMGMTYWLNTAEAEVRDWA